METDFEKDLEWSIGNEVKRKNYAILLRHLEIKKIDFKEQENKKNPNDIDIELYDGTKINVEIKNYKKANWNEISLEIWNDTLINPKTEGWVFKLEENQTDYVLFTWIGKEKECYLIVRGRELGRWWRENYSKYEEKLNWISVRGKNKWRSSYAKVPISDLPKNIIVVHKIFVDLNDFWRESK